jgi:peptidoglycan/xylan/chitin deacetylase (PgdA/CDA1 family)
MGKLQTAVNALCGLYGATLGQVRGHSLVLCYHNVQSPVTNRRGWLSDKRAVDADLFEAQMRWLKDNAVVLTLEELVAGAGGQRGLRVAVTFDDGYLNNAEVVAPIMRRLNLPMTWFVATGYMDDSELLPWWDLIDLALERCAAPLELNEPETRGSHDPAVPSQRRWLDTTLRNIIKSATPARRDAIAGDLAAAVGRQQALPPNAFARAAEVAAATCGLIELGGHTVTHPNVAKCPPDVLADEIAQGRQRLEEIGGKRVRWFAYPFGGKGAFDRSSAEAVRQAGFSGALTLLPGVVRADTDRFRLPRIPVSPGLDLDAFKARVARAPVYIALDRLRTMRKQGSSYG